MGETTLSGGECLLPGLPLVTTRLAAPWSLVTTFLVEGLIARSEHELHATIHARQQLILGRCSLWHDGVPLYSSLPRT